MDYIRDVIEQFYGVAQCVREIVMPLSSREIFECHEEENKSEIFKCDYSEIDHVCRCAASLIAPAACAWPPDSPRTPIIMRETMPLRSFFS